jgi:hypothetical protein
VKLGKNASDTCAMISKTSGVEATKICQVFLSGIYGSMKNSMMRSQMKIVLITFFDIKGIIYFEFIPLVRQAYYVEILKQLREAVRRKSPEL